MTPAASVCLPNSSTCYEMLSPRETEPAAYTRLPSATESVRDDPAGQPGVKSSPGAEPVPSNTSAEPTLAELSSRDGLATGGGCLPRAAEPITGREESAEVVLAELARLAPWLVNGELEQLRQGSNRERAGVAEPCEVGAGRSEAPALAPPPQQVRWFDADLTPLQKEVVHRALKSGGIFLIQGPPASGKLRAVVELVRQWLARGDRLVITSPRTETLQAFLERLERATDGARTSGWRGEDFLVVYCPAEDGSEPGSSLQPWLAEVRTKKWVHSWQHRCWVALKACQTEADRLARATKLLEQLEELCQACRQEQDLQQTRNLALQRLAERYRLWVGQPNDTGCDPPDDSWVRECAELQQALDQEKRKHEACLADLHQRLQQLRCLLQESSQQVSQWQEKVKALEEIVAVKRARAFWRWLWWKTLFQTRSAERLAEFQARWQESQQQYQDCLQQCQELEQEIAREQQRHVSARIQIIKAALEKQREELERDLADTQNRLAELLRQWCRQREQLRSVLADWDCPETPPSSPTLLRQQQERCRRQQQHLASQVVYLQQVLEALGQWGDGQSDTIVRRAHVCAAPLEALLRQKALRRAERMIVLDAHEIPAQVWDSLHVDGMPVVLSGEPVCRTTWCERSPTQTVGPLAEPQTQLLEQQWQELGGGTVLPSCRWLQSAAGITCQLTPMLNFRPEQIRVEPLADHPEVILRFIETPAQGRVLAEVFFPSPRYDVSLAKTFLTSQLEQLYLWPVGPRPRWREGEEHWYCEWLPLHAEHLAEALPAAKSIRVDYGQGIVEELLAVSENDGRTAWRTLRVCFEKSCGWTAASAEQWLRENSHHGPHSDAAWLWCWRGGTGPLGDWPAWVLGYLATGNLSGLWRLPAKRSQRGSSVRQRSHSPDTVDLASDQRKRLPLAWQCVLPARGFIHPQQAEQLIARLRELIPTLRSLASNWWFVGWWDMAQLELLRWLWRQGQSEKDIAGDFFSLRVDPLLATGKSNKSRLPPTAKLAPQPADGVLLILESMPTSPDGVHWQDWVECAALTQRCLVLLEPDYERCYRQLNARGYNSAWLSDLLQRVAKLPVVPMD